MKENQYMHILVAEDHPELGEDLKKGLEQCSYTVDLVADGERALTSGLAIPYDLIILDILLPGLSGLQVCQQLRSHKRSMPILLLTALGQVEQRVRGLDAGADDYMSKPFDFRELEARVSGLVQRGRTAPTTVLRFLDLTLDPRTYEVYRGERLIRLTSKEFTLLKYLMSHPREILSRVRIAQEIWEDDADSLSNVIEAYMSYLRRKLCANGEPDLIRSIRGVGYRLQEVE
jgi:DNA-binding response OmpR family regulator